MKNLLLLTLLSIFVFSCTEYDDDGLQDNIVLFNPDGTKKVKSVATTSSSAVDLNFNGFPVTDLDVAMQLESNSNLLFSQQNFGFTQESRTSVNVTGLTGTQIGQSTLALTHEFQDSLIVNKLKTTNRAGNYTNYRSEFSYTDGKLSQILQYSAVTLLSTLNVTYVENQVLVEVLGHTENYDNQTWVLNTVGNLITSGNFTNNVSGENVSFELVRNGITVNQLVLNSSLGDNATGSYTYDAYINPMHYAGTTPTDLRLSLETVAISELIPAALSSDEIDLAQVEKSFRNLFPLAGNNITQASFNGSSYLQRNYTYDILMYPIGFTESTQLGNDESYLSLVNSLTSSMVPDLAELYRLYLVSQETPSEEIDALVATMSENLTSNLMSRAANSHVITQGTIAYFE